ncbi:MAG: DUF2848 domain-containing protein [Pseudomonadota bacterium]|nr:DUF2848 domain-containing protein [Pseudomonadota bacterium]
MKLRFETDGAAFDFEAAQLVVAGWTGRDRAAIEHHIDELARLGVPRPSTVPLYYRLARSLLTQDATIEALGSASSGEAEPVLLRHAGRWWLTLGSDHTDRAAEAHSVALSKQLCAKPLARVAWDWDELAARADQLLLRSSILEDGHWVVYQHGALSAITALADLVSGLPDDVVVSDGLVLFCGTLGAIANQAGVAIRSAGAMRLELIDPPAARQITHEYHITALPMVA